ncbi:unnamed protein product [Kuraishia capsulata CBS 1993]|uniref:Major facilitator superfamily (MFS) profile domain-containing protein n=1 Tax=Kuraishia capsulata CBS 1993 TaxID=1382522 RepID=W6MRK3_9ASCO|nr:uncharacterized protein KUCA_T00005374001 [Kuraishia capsulata CBS 1993]CDK29386.1 unnamed protein product [Kuraishia capsulata CBS 1993]
MAFLSPLWYQFLVCCFASVGSFTYGYDLGIIAQVIASESFISFYNNPSSIDTGLVVSLFTAGAFCGAFFAGFMSEYLGRRLTITGAAIVFLFGSGLQAGAQNMKFLLSGRFIGGLGVGIFTMIIPLYQAELAHPRIRGSVTALQQFFLGIGSLCASWIGYGCYLGFDTNNQWRVPLGIQLIPAGILGSLIFFFPESPRWLIEKGRYDEGHATLARLMSGGDLDAPVVQVELNDIKNAIDDDRLNRTSWLDIIKKPSNFRRVFIAVSLQGSVQMTGVSAIQYYSPTIFAQMGLSTGRTLLYQAINSIIALIAQAFCIAFVDKLGRRWPLILGNFGNCLCFIVGCILLAQFPPWKGEQPRSAQIGFIASTWIYNFIFSCTCGPLSWVIPAEIFNSATRSKGVAIATMTCFAMNTMIGQITDKAMNDVYYKYYYLFIICNFTNAIFFWAILPETKGTPLEQMNNLFENAPWFVPTMKRHNYLSDFETEVKVQQLKHEDDVKPSFSHRDEGDSVSDHA